MVCGHVMIGSRCVSGRMMAFSLTPRQLMQAKEAIEMLSNLSGEGQSSSGLANTQARTAAEAIPPSRSNQQPTSSSSSSITVSSSEAREGI